MRRAFRELNRKAQEFGFRFKGTQSSGHLRFENPETGVELTTANSPKNLDHTLKEFARDAKRYSTPKQGVTETVATTQHKETTFEYVARNIDELPTGSAVAVNDFIKKIHLPHLNINTLRSYASQIFRDKDWDYDPVERVWLHPEMPLPVAVTPEQRQPEVTEKEDEVPTQELEPLPQRTPGVSAGHIMKPLQPSADVYRRPAICTDDEVRHYIADLQRLLLVRRIKANVVQGPESITLEIPLGHCSCE